jgi:hypothetical protein
MFRCSSFRPWTSSTLRRPRIARSHVVCRLETAFRHHCVVIVHHRHHHHRLSLSVNVRLLPGRRLSMQGRRAGPRTFLSVRAPTYHGAACCVWAWGCLCMLVKSVNRRHHVASSSVSVV